MNRKPFLALAVIVASMLAGGCLKERGEPPGVRYRLTIITKTSDGQAQNVQEPVLVESATVCDDQQVRHEGQEFVVRTLKTQYGKTTFEVTFPNHSSQRCLVKLGEPKEIFPKGQRTGVRIEVEESH